MARGLSEAGTPKALLDQIMDSEVLQSLEGLPVQHRSTVLLAGVEGSATRKSQLTGKSQGSA